MTQLRKAEKKSFSVPLKYPLTIRNLKRIASSSQIKREHGDAIAERDKYDAVLLSIIIIIIISRLPSHIGASLFMFDYFLYLFFFPRMAYSAFICCTTHNSFIISYPAFLFP